MNSLVEIIKNNLNVKPYHEQEKLYNHFTEFANSNAKVALIEASTGIGKTLTVLASIVDAIKKGEVVVVALPTKILIKQMKENVDSVDFLSGKSMVIYSKADIVSPKQIIRLIQQECSETQSKVNSWIADQSKAIDDPYLLESLIKIAPEIKEKIEGATLNSLHDNNCGAYDYYKSQFHESTDTKLIICTHSMLAIDANLRFIKAKQEANTEGINLKDKEYFSSTLLADYITSKDEQYSFLPPYQSVFIDEGHLFQSNLAKILTAKTSFWKISRSIDSLPSLKAKTKLRKTILEIERFLGDNIELAEYNELNYFNLAKTKPSEAKGFVDNLNNLKKGLGHAKVSKADKNSGAYTYLLNQSKAIESFLFKIKNKGAKITFSPQKNYPSLEANIRTSGNLLDFMYRSHLRTLFLSATLTFPHPKHKTDSYHKFQYILNIDKSLLFTAPPVIGDFIYKSVKLSISSDERLLPVNLKRDRSNKSKVDDWVSQVTKQIMAEAKGAKGGLLILNTSYETVALLSAKVTEQIGEESIVTATKAFNVHKQKERFISKSKESVKPIWFAVGSAWTGLDISGKDIGLSASEDNLLTNIVIPRLPVNAPKTVTTGADGKSSNSLNYNGGFESYILLRQGLGRLIRRKGLPNNRKITILDPRLKIDSSTPKFVLNAMEHAFNRYASPILKHKKTKKKVVIR